MYAAIVTEIEAAGAGLITVATAMFVIIGLMFAISKVRQLAKA